MKTTKRLITAILATIMLIATTSITAFANEKDGLKKYVTPATPITVTVTDAQTPYIKEGVLMVPFNAVFEAIGAKTMPFYDKSLNCQMQYAQFDNVSLVAIGDNNKKTIYVGSRIYGNEVDWEYKNNEPFIPASSVTKATKHFESQPRFVNSQNYDTTAYANAIGVTATYDEATKTMTIAKTGQPIQAMSTRTNEPYQITDLEDPAIYKDVLSISEKDISDLNNAATTGGGTFKIEQVNPTTGAVIKDLGTFTAGELKNNTMSLAKGKNFIGNIDKDGTYRITTVTAPEGYRFATAKEANDAVTTFWKSLDASYVAPATNPWVQVDATHVSLTKTPSTNGVNFNLYIVKTK